MAVVASTSHARNCWQPIQETRSYQLLISTPMRWKCRSSNRNVIRLKDLNR